MDDERLLIRQATSGDAEPLLLLLAQLQQESTTFEVTGDRLNTAAQAEQIRQIGQSPQQLMLVAVVDQQLVGLLTILPLNESEGEVGVAVLKQFWHQGIGTELMLSGLDWAALDSHFDVIALTVQAVNRFAVQLYQSIGFQVTSDLTVKNTLNQSVKAFEMKLAVK